MAAAAAGGPDIALSTMCVDDGGGNPVSITPFVPSDLVNQVYSTQINALYVNPNDSTIMMAEMVLPSNVGGWSMRGIGIRDSDGMLFAYAKFPETYKPVADESGTRDMIVSIALKVGNSEDVQLVIDTSIVIATRPWVFATITAAFIIPGGLTNQVLRKKSNADGDTEWAYITDAINVAVDVIEEPQTTVGGQAIYTLLVCTTDGVAVYIEGVRRFDFTVLNETQIKLTTPYPTSGKEIVFVQNEPNEPLKLRRLVLARALYLSGV